MSSIYRESCSECHLYIAEIVELKAELEKLRPLHAITMYKKTFKPFNDHCPACNTPLRVAKYCTGKKKFFFWQKCPPIEHFHSFCWKCKATWLENCM